MNPTNYDKTCVVVGDRDQLATALSGAANFKNIVSAQSNKF